MAEATYLEIEGEEDGAARVVELPGAAIRVGRGPVCEVRLPDPDLAEVQCLLRRRGETWHVQPIGPAGLVTLAGHAVDQLRPLPADEPLRVGSYRLMIRHDGGERFRSPIEVVADEPRVEPTSAGPAGRPSVPALVGDDDRLRRWQARAELRERWLQTRQDEKKWEARWRAAGEGLKARGQGTAGRGSPAERTTIPPPAPVRAVPPIPRIVPSTPTHEPRGLPAGHRRAPTVAEDLGDVSEAPVEARAGGGEVSPANNGPRLREDRDVATAAPPIRLDEPPTARIEVPTAAEPPPAPHAADPDPLPPSSGEQGAGPMGLDARQAPDTETSPAGGEDEADHRPTSDAVEARPDGPIVESAPRRTSRGLRIFSRLVAPAAPPADPGPIGAEPTDPMRPGWLGHPAVEPGAGTTITPPPTGSNGRARREFVDAATILAAQGQRAIPEPARGRKPRRHTIPTDPIAPPHWSLPAWAAVPPMAVGALGVLGVGLILAVGWTKDNLSAGLAARAALRAEDAKPVTIDPAERVESRWWRTTAGHLALWSVAIERSPDADARRDEVREALDAARAAAPLEPTIRLAMARLAIESGRPGAEALGLSRDVAALTCAGRALKRAGKADAALRAYRSALDLAAGADPARLSPPAFDDDPQVRRFRLPHEAIVAGVVRDLVEVGGWEFAAWSAALPPRAVVRLAAARVLRDRGEADAEKLLAMALADDVEAPDDPALAAEDLAARAEALALSERRAEAADRYREAIAGAADDATRRRWLLALAEILAPIGRSAERAEILEAAKATDPTDEVTRKAVEAQRFAGLK